MSDTSVRALASWLSAPTLQRLTVDTRMITMHGLAPHLARTVDEQTGANMSAELAAWIRAQDAANAARLERLHSELAVILAAAASAGIDVMPLKGALLTTLDQFGGYSRPMADLDLLVQPNARSAMRDVLEQVGYRHVLERSPRPTHDVFVAAGTQSVVSADEHPDNPRPVELHVEVVRHLWGWQDEDQLTDRLWARSRPGAVLGQPASVPHIDDLFAHMAVHASSDLLVGRGRLVQLLDLALVAQAGATLIGLVHERMAYPALRLAARVLPRPMSAIDLAPLEARMPRGLRSWATAVPFDHRAGLLAAPPRPPSSWSARWARWAPRRWRLAVAFGDGPTLRTWFRYVRLVGLRWRGRFRYLRS